MANDLVTLDNVHGVVSEITEAFMDIPFENSDFQTKAFVLAAQVTPGRAYRALGLQMHSKVNVVKHYLFEQEKLKIDVEEREAKIASDETNEFERRRLRLENVRAIDGQAYGQKLLNDALRELNLLYAEFKKFPPYTREQFEAEEGAHFMVRLDRQMKGGGAFESLMNMNEDLPSMPKRIENAKKHIIDAALLEVKAQ